MTNSDKNSIHIFYTGSTVAKPAFGCGPSPYFLNVSRVLFNGGYATAQLTAHELGHCLGLRHTNVPQFDDLPPSDKFGWINCDAFLKDGPKSELLVDLQKPSEKTYVRLIFNEIKSVLSKGENVRISGFASFNLRVKKARNARNPKTGELIVIKSRKVLSFKPSRYLLESTNG